MTTDTRVLFVIVFTVDDLEGEACEFGGMTTVFFTVVPNTISFISRELNESLDIDSTSSAGAPRYIW